MLPDRLARQVLQPARTLAVRACLRRPAGHAPAPWSTTTESISVSTLMLTRCRTLILDVPLCGHLTPWPSSSMACHVRCSDVHGDRSPRVRPAHTELRWVQEAEADRQRTFLRLALNAAARLPWTLPLLRSGGFLQAVSRLHKAQCAWRPSCAAALCLFADSTCGGLVMQLHVTSAQSSGYTVDIAIAGRWVCQQTQTGCCRSGHAWRTHTLPPQPLTQGQRPPTGRQALWRFLADLLLRCQRKQLVMLTAPLGCLRAWPALPKLR